MSEVKDVSIDDVLDKMKKNKEINLENQENHT